MLRDGGVNAGLQADGFIERVDDLHVVREVVVVEAAIFAVFEPFVADLIAADVKVPDAFGNAREILHLVYPDAPAVACAGVGRGVADGLDEVRAFDGEGGEGGGIRSKEM